MSFPCPEYPRYLKTEHGSETLTREHFGVQNVKTNLETPKRECVFIPVSRLYLRIKHGSKSLSYEQFGAQNTQTNLNLLRNHDINGRSQPPHDAKQFASSETNGNGIRVRKPRL